MGRGLGWARAVRAITAAGAAQGAACLHAHSLEPALASNSFFSAPGPAALRLETPAHCAVFHVAPLPKQTPPPGPDILARMTQSAYPSAPSNKFLHHAHTAARLPPFSMLPLCPVHGAR